MTDRLLTPDIIEEDEKPGEQSKNKPSPADRLKPWQYKKGQSGNPAGRPKGISLKEYAKLKFAAMTDEEKEEFMNGLSKETIWEMGEGRPDTKTDLTTGGDKISIPTEELVSIAKQLNELTRNNTRESISSDGVTPHAVDSKVQD